MRSDGSWKCPCGVTVEHERDPLDEDDPLVLELDGVVHECDAEDEEL